MKKALLLLAGLLATHLAVPAQAADDTSGGMDKMGMHKMMGGKTMGMHRMTGTVDKIDHTKGMLALKTDEGDLMLHFPPASIKDLNNGDTIMVKLSYSKESPKK